MATAKLICIEGYWNDDNKPFEKRCLVMPLGLTDSMRDEVLDSLIDKNNLFYIFDAGERIMGVHRDFTVTFMNPIDELEVPAVC
jgi:hypothetical protein